VQSNILLIIQGKNKNFKCETICRISLKTSTGMTLQIINFVQSAIIKWKITLGLKKEAYVKAVNKI
jgi:hypothetical protein